jgi:hypothetical protein
VKVFNAQPTVGDELEIVPMLALGAVPGWHEFGGENQSSSCPWFQFLLHKLFW